MTENGSLDHLQQLVRDFEAQNPYAAAVRHLSDADANGLMNAPRTDLIRANAILALAFEQWKRGR